MSVSHRAVNIVFDAHCPETRSYDGRGRVVTRSWSSGRTLTYGYNDFDRVTSVADSHGPSVSLEYDVMQRMVRRTETPQGGGAPKVWGFMWDDRDRLVRVTDSGNQITRIEYDRVAVGCNVVDKPSRIIAPGSKVTAMEYDSRQRLTRITNPKGEVNRFEYNLRGDLIAMTDAEGHRSQRFYDGNGRLIVPRA